MPGPVPLEDTWVDINVASSSTGPFDFTFKNFEKADITIYVDDVALVDTAWTLTPGAADPYAGFIGGQITLNTAVANAKVTIAREMDAERESNLTGQQMTMSAVNTRLNEHTMHLQDLRRDFSRTLRSPYGAAVTAVTAAALTSLTAIATEIEQVAAVDTEILALGQIVSDIQTLAANINAISSDSSVWKQSVRVSTVENGDLATAFAAGQTVNGVVLVADDRVLLKDQTAAAENGIYVVPASGAPTRANDFDNGTDVAQGAVIFIEEGASNSNKLFSLATSGAITIGTTDLTFSELSGSGGGSEVAYITVSALASASAGTSASDTARVVEAGREGVFKWDASDLSAKVTADTRQGIYVAPSSDATGASGAWVRIIEDAVNVRWYGAVGDGATNDTPAIQAAVASGYNVRVPGLSGGNFYSVTTAISCTTAGQIISGDGDRSQIRQLGADANANVFVVSGVEGVEFRELYVRPGTSITSTYHGFSFLFEAGSHGGKVINCRVTDHRRGGVMAIGSNRCEFAFNEITDSVVNPATDDSSQAGCDIWLVNGCNYCQVHHNISRNGAGTGMAIQAISDSTNDHNNVSDNVVSEAYSYGIYLYVGDANYEVDHNVVANNVIDTVYGSVESFGAGNQPFGCGIYVQGAEHTTVTGNSVQRACISTNVETLTPAGIGMTNCRSALIANNTCTDSAWYGIMVVHSNNNATFDDAVTIVEGNRVYNSALDGIYAKNLEKSQINGNTIIGSGVRGIRVNNATVVQLDHVSMGNNYIADTGNAGIEVNDAKFVESDGNMCMDCGSRGQVYGSCENININGGHCDLSGTFGLYFNSCDGVIVDGIRITKAGDHGIWLQNSTQVTVSATTISEPDGFGVRLDGCTDVTMNAVAVFDAAVGGVSTQGFSLATSTAIKLIGCTAKVDAGTGTMVLGIGNNASDEVQIIGGEYEGSTSGTGGTAPDKCFIDDNVIIEPDTTWVRKPVTQVGGQIAVNKFFSRYYVTGSGNLDNINGGRNNQLIYLTFTNSFTIRHAAGNIVLKDGASVAVSNGGSIRRSMVLRKEGSNWIEM